MRFVTNGVCKDCGKTEFYAYQRHRNWCVDCQREYNYRRIASQRQHFNEINSKNYHKRKDRNPKLSWAKHCIRTTRERAITKGHDHNLDWEFMYSILPDTCPALDIPIMYTNGKTADNSPSVDRYDNNKGYTKDNVVVISYKANSMKSNATTEEVERLANWMRVKDKEDNV